MFFWSEGLFRFQTPQKQMNNWPRRDCQRRLRCETLESRVLLAVTMTDHEQLMVYLVNRARNDPLAEAARYGIDLNEGLPAGTISSDLKQPLVPHQALVNAAVDHSLDMLARDFFDHVNPDGQDWVDRATEAGYASTFVGENLSWEGSTGPLDHDSQPTRRHESLFRSPTHRQNLLLDLYQDIGVGLRFGGFTDSGVTYNAAMVTQDFGRRNADTYLVGVVFDDANGNRVYDLREGIADATVRVGDQIVTTGGSGCWSLQVPAGTYTVTVEGGAFTGTASREVIVGSRNVELDFISGQSWGIVDFVDTQPPQAADDQYFAEAGQTLLVPAGLGLLANDVNPTQDVLTPELVEPPEHGTVKVDPDGSFSYEPVSGFRGIDRFTYRASAGQELSNLATATLVVAESVGDVDFWHIAQVDLANGDAWYRFETVRSGLLTVEATGAQGDTLALYDSTLEPLASSSQDPARIDLAVDGPQTFYLSLSGTGQISNLRVANLVATGGTEIQVFGTAGADTFEFVPTGSYGITINGVGYHFDDTQYETVVFNGAAGDDAAILTGGPDEEIARLFPNHGTFGENGFLVTVNDVSAITAHGGGGGDLAFMYDSADDDEFLSRKGYGKLSGIGFALETYDFMYNYGYATTPDGGRDVAYMEDTPTADKFKFDWPKPGQFFGKMYGGGIYYNRAKNFEQIVATMTDGKNGVRLFDSEGDDTFYGQRDSSRLTGTGFDVSVSGYNSLIAYASTGDDIAHLEDSADDDSTRARPHKIVLWGGEDANPTYELTARRFDEYHFEGKHGGYDRAKFHDTVFDDHADVSGDTASLYRNDGGLDLLYDVVGFDWVRLYATDNGSRDTLTKDDPLSFDFVYDGAMWEEVP